MAEQVLKGVHMAFYQCRQLCSFSFEYRHAVFNMDGIKHLNIKQFSTS